MNPAFGQLVLIGAIAGAVCAAQPAPDSAGPKPLPSLDELLGLMNDQGAPGSNDAELDRALAGETQRGEPFAEAVELMERSRSRLGDERDAGVPTQRLQAMALARLDQAIESARSSQNQNSSSSSSSSSSQSSRSQPNQRQSTADQAGTGDNRAEPMAPGLQGVTTGPDIDSTSAAWGALPDRLRGALLQGVSDRYSAMYERLTERYYRRLAEEADE